MAMRRLTLPIIFAFLLFSQVFARDLEEKPDNKDVAGSEDAKFPFGYGGHHPPPRCRFYCHGHCCSAEEFAAISRAADQVDASIEKHEADFYRPGPRFPPRFPPHFPPRRPPYCGHYCGPRCCSAQEYAEYVQGRN